ncbi:MAG: cation diffusion facilitator family transporter [Saprospiraceae bacterium]
MEHAHHHHHHTAELTNVSRAFLIGIVLNSLFVLIEFGAGFYWNSLALISDAGHNLSDVASLILALLAFRLAKVKSSKTFTYGYRKTTILASLTNAVILLIAIGSIAWESIERLQNPQVVAGNSIAIVAGIGIVINSVSAFLFFRDKDHDLNVKGAYLHLAADALVSLGVVVAGIVISFTQWFWLDTVVSLAIVVVIFFSTWGLLKESVILSLEGVPSGIDLQEVKQHILKIAGVKDVHHVHIWALSTTENALTAHIVTDSSIDWQSIATMKHKIKHELEHLNIQHATLEVEMEDEPCEAGDC